MIKGGVKRADVSTLAAEICKEVANSEEFAAKRSSRRNEHMIKELIAEAERTCLTVYDQIARSKYRILAAEQKFGYKEALKPLKLFTGKRNVYLRGTMDRVDESDDYVRVIDYKTGEISTKESDLFVGTKAQLYLYMNTAMENYDKPLAGAYYFPISREFEKEPEETRLRGKTLLNLDAVAQQDIAFEKPFDKQKSSVIDLTLFYNKEGALSAGRSTNALSADALHAYATYSKLLTEGALAEMEEGFIAPTPYGEQCKTCTYSGICGREEALDGAPRSVGKVKPETIVTAVSHAEGNGDSLTDSEASSTDKTPATPAPKTTQTGRTNNDEKEDA
jgi:ATP-dependent helicase/nuclease subunit B